MFDRRNEENREWHSRIRCGFVLPSQRCRARRRAGQQLTRPDARFSHRSAYQPTAALLLRRAVVAQPSRGDAHEPSGQRLSVSCAMHSVQRTATHNAAPIRADEERTDLRTPYRS